MSYRGISTTIPLGAEGLLTDVGPGSIPATSLIEATNVSLEEGYIQKAPGSRKFNSNALTDKVVSLFDWNPNIALQRLIAATADGKLWRDIGDKTFSGTTPINSGLGLLKTSDSFVAGGNETAGRARKLFFFSSTNQVQVLSGDASVFETIDTPAADWTTPNFPTKGIIHQNRMWAIAGGILYASDTGNHEDFVSNSLFFNVFPGEGGALNNIFVYKGRLFIFKEGGFVYYLEDFSIDSSTWFIKKLANGFTLASANAIQQVVDDLVLGNESGSLTSLKATEAFGDIESGDVLANQKMEKYMRQHTHASGFEFMHSLYYLERKQAYFTYRSSYGSDNDLILVLDVNRGTRTVFWDKDNAECFALRHDINGVLRPIYGNAAGFVFLMDQVDRDVGGVAYEGAFKTPHIDMRHLDPELATKQKHFDWLQVEFVPTGAFDLNADVFIDGVFRETVTFKLKNRSDGLGPTGGFKLGGTEAGTPLGRTDAQRTPQVRVRGKGQRISIKFYNSGLKENFKIASYTIGFRLAGNAATRI